MPRLKIAFTSLTDDDLRELLIASPALVSAVAPMARVMATDLTEGRTRALRSLRSAAMAADTNRLGSWLEPLLHDVENRLPRHLQGKRVVSEEDLDALLGHLRRHEPSAVTLIFLAAVADRSERGGEFLEDRWTDVMARLIGKTGTASTSDEYDPGTFASTSSDLGSSDLGRKLHDLAASVARIRFESGEVARTLQVAADTIDSVRPRANSLADVTAWFARADGAARSVGALLGVEPASLAEMAAALDDRQKAVREAEHRSRQAEEERRKREAGRRILTDAAARLREVGLYDQAEEILARLGIEESPASGESGTAAVPGDAPNSPAPEQIDEAVAEWPSAPPPVEKPDRPPSAPKQTADEGTEQAGTAPESEAPGQDATPAGAPRPADAVVEAPELPTREAGETVATASPWDEGEPPRIVSLVLAGEYGLACLLAKAAGESKVRRQAIRFFAAAMSCDPADLAAKQAGLVPDEEDLNSAGADEARVLLAACLRFGLTAGYSPVGLQQLVDRASIESAPSHDLIAPAVQTVHRGQIRPTVENSSFPQLLKQWDGLAAAAEELRKTLLQRNIKLPRASRILHDLVKDGNELGSALIHIGQLANAGPPAGGSPDERVKELQRLATQLQDRSKLRALIDKADSRVSTNSQLRNEIVANARTRLEESIDDVRGFIDRSLGLYSAIRQAVPTTDFTQIDALRRAAGQYQPPTEIRTVGSAALHQLALWLAEEPAPVGAYTVEAFEQHAARLVFEMGRDEKGRPNDRVTLRQLQGVLDGRTLTQAVRGHLERGNVAMALRLLDGAPEFEQANMLRDECQQARRDLKQQHGKKVAKVEAAIAKLRSVGRDEPAHEIEEKLEELHDTYVDRFDLTRAQLDRVLEEAEGNLEQHQEELRERIDRHSPSDTDKARISALLDNGDEVTAEEFLTLLDSGQPLPEDNAESTDDDFTEFFPRVVELATAATAEASDPKDDVIAQLRRKQGTGDSMSEIIRDGIASWRTLRQHRIANTQTPHLRRSIADVLRMLGLVPAEGNYLNTLSDAPRTRSALFQVRAKPAGRSYVPQFGTQANGRYNVAIMWERATPGRLLGLLPDRLRTGPNIILYFGTLPAQQRLQLRSLSSPGRDTNGMVLLVDEAVIGWLASREEPDFRLTQRITLPFSSINPYTPFAGGDVPDEVFVGRDRERAELESPTGSMFVYGGRQLGKSALLRRVEKLFTESTSQPSTGRRVALYLDLKSEGIGESHEPKELWALLNRHLKSLDVLPSAIPANAGPQVVSDGIKQWLGQDEANRLLLLLDEADLFLTADFTPSESGARFQTLQGLKNLMESSGRRFKPVFAGLHQVQRFHDSANTPVAHGGTDILIGPLRAAEVRKLVVEPLRAIGYEFERNELVWRVAAFTNYQASLVQIFCEALVNHLRERSLPPSGGRITITSYDIDAVYTNRDVRNLIGQRFRWTINLDNRYRVIAIVVALLSNDSPAGARFNPEDLREYCEAYWPEAFSSDVLTRKEFIRYLDEMVGLGVLRRIGESYGMRSPNVVAMLGTPSALDHELREASVHFELPYEYNPTMSRAAMPAASRRSAPRRSPLTDADIADLIGERNHDSGNTSRVLRAGSRYSTALVTGSSALGIDRVVQALTISADARGRLQFESTTLAEVPRLLSDNSGGRHRFLLVECPPGRQQQFEAEYARALRAVAALRTVRAIVVVNSAEYPVPEENSEASGEMLRLSLRRWSVEGLRAWHDFPFDNPQERGRLHELTSGWPALVENAVLLVSEGRSTEDVLDSLAVPFPDPQPAAAFLSQAGLGEHLDEAVLWAQYCATIDPVTHRIVVEAVTHDDLEAIWNHDAKHLVDRLVNLDIVEQDATGKGWVLDRIVAAALLRCAG